MIITASIFMTLVIFKERLILKQELHKWFLIMFIYPVKKNTRWYKNKTIKTLISHLTGEQKNDPKRELEGPRRSVLGWGHSMCWGWHEGTGMLEKQKGGQRVARAEWRGESQAMGLEGKKLAHLWEWIQHCIEILSQKLCQS